MQSIASLSSLAALGWKKSAKSTFRFTLSAISGAVPITLVTSQAGSVVDWGDGSTTTLASGTNNLSHTYSGYTSANVSVSNAQYITQLSYSGSAASFGCTTTALPRGLTYLDLGGANTLSGNASDLPRGLTSIILSGSNTLSGNASDLPSVLALLNIRGLNTLSGNASDLPRGLTYLDLIGLNTLSGNASDLPRGLTYLNLTGSNTLSGNASDLPSVLAFLNIRGLNTINIYATRTWPSSMRYVTLTPVAPGGIPSAQIDQWLIDLATYATAWTSPKQISLTGTNGARTTASDAAVTTLQGRGVTVTTN